MQYQSIVLENFRGYYSEYNTGNIVACHPDLIQLYFSLRILSSLQPAPC